MSGRLKVQDATGGVIDGPDSPYKLVAYGRGAPTASVSGFEKGCLYFDVTNAVLYYNSGTTASATWLILTGYATQPTLTVTELNLLSGLLATAAELNRTSDVSTRLVTIAAAATTLTLSEATHEGKIVLLQSTGGLAITPPAAVGSGDRYELLIKTTISGGSVTLDAKAGNASDVFLGRCYQLKVGTGEVVYAAASNSNLLTLDGTTTGGLAGDRIYLVDMATNKWYINFDSTASGTVATPFSNH